MAKWKISKTVILLGLLLAVGFCEEEEEELVPVEDESFPEQNDVIILSDTNFKSVLENYDSILVLFDSPSSSKSLAARPSFEEAATILKAENPHNALARLDCSSNPGAKAYFSIDRYPTINWIVKGVIKSYKGGRTSRDFIQWVRTRSSTSFVEINSQEDWTQLTEERMVAAFYGSMEHPDVEIFKKLPVEFEDVSFGIITSPEIAQTVGFESVSSFGVWNYSRGAFTVYAGENAYPVLKQWIYSQTDVSIATLSRAVSRRVFNSGTPSLILLADENSENAAKAIKLLRDDEKSLCTGSSLRCVLTNVGLQESRTLGSFLGIKVADQPVFTIVMPGTEVFKYRLDAEGLESPKLLQWVEDYRTGLLEPYFKSASTESSQEPDNNGIIPLIGANFEAFIQDTESDSIIIFYTDGCTRCKKAIPEFESFAKAMKTHDKVKIARMDMISNDARGYTISDMPTILYFRRDKIGGKPAQMKGNFSEVSLIKFVRQNSTDKIKLDENKKKSKKGPKPKPRRSATKEDL